MCVGFWSLEHPDFALYVQIAATSSSPMVSDSVLDPAGSYAPIETSSSLVRLRLLIGTPSGQSAPTTTEKATSCPVETSPLAGPGQASVARAGSLSCVSPRELLAACYCTLVCAD